MFLWFTFEIVFAVAFHCRSHKSIKLYAAFLLIFGGGAKLLFSSSLANSLCSSRNSILHNLVVQWMRIAHTVQLVFFYKSLLVVTFEWIWRLALRITLSRRNGTSVGKPNRKRQCLCFVNITMLWAIFEWVCANLMQPIRGAAGSSLANRISQDIPFA